MNSRELGKIRVRQMTAGAAVAGVVGATVLGVGVVSHNIVVGTGPTSPADSTDGTTDGTGPNQNQYVNPREGRGFDSGSNQAPGSGVQPLRGRSHANSSGS